MLRIEGQSWAEIARSTGVGYSTLMEWRLLPQWEQARLRVLSAVPEALLYKARRVYEKRLDHELTRKVPDVTVAREIVSWYDERLFRGGPDGDPPGGYAAHPGVVILPMQNQGLESRPATQVLVAPSKPPAAPSPALAETPRKEYGPTTRRRRIVGPDE